MQCTYLHGINFREPKLLTKKITPLQGTKYLNERNFSGNNFRIIKLKKKKKNSRLLWDFLSQSSLSSKFHGILFPQKAFLKVFM